MAVLTPVRAQAVGASALTAGVGLWLGLAAALICGGVCVIVGGTLAELSTPDEEGVTDGGPSTTD